jgi:hypothetical protein
MTDLATGLDTRFWRGARWLVWGGAACLLLLPLVAMQFAGSGVDWTGLDFVFAAVMLGLVCIAFEVALRVARSNAYIVAVGFAVAAGFTMTWSNLAVGIIGNEDNPANLMFFGVLAVALAGVLWSRLRPLGMARAMEATALAQAVVCVAALVLDSAYVFVITGIFMAMWLLSAQLFRRAARAQRRRMSTHPA